MLPRSHLCNWSEGAGTRDGGSSNSLQLPEIEERGTDQRKKESGKNVEGQRKAGRETLTKAWGSMSDWDPSSLGGTEKPLKGSIMRTQ